MYGKNSLPRKSMGPLPQKTFKMTKENQTRTLAGDLLAAATAEVKQNIEKQSPTGFSLKMFVQSATPKNIDALQKAICSVWLTTCGCDALRVNGIALDSPIQGLNKFLLGNAEVYTEIEALFIETVRAWNPPAVNMANIPLGTSPTFYVVTLKDGREIYARNVKAAPEGFELTKIEIEAEPTLLTSPVGISPEHPLAAFLSGYTDKGRAIVATNLVSGVSKETSPALRLARDSALRKQLVGLLHFAIEDQIE